MMKKLSMLGALAVLALLVAPATHAQTCVGDCNGDGMVSINELIVGVNIDLGSQPASKCPPFQNAQGDVNIAQLIKGVNNALNGCGGGATPTPTATPGGGTFTDKVFMIDAGSVTLPPCTTPGNSTANCSASGIFTTGLSGANAANMFPPGPITLQLGTPDANGIAQLRLKEDVYLDISIVDGSRLCMHLVASTSSGTVACNGGVSYDIMASQPASEAVLFTLTFGLGSPAGPGNGNLLVDVDEQQVATDSPDFPKPCDQVQYVDPRQQYGFTTTNAISHKETPSGPSDLTETGQPFDCTNWATSNGAQIAAPAPRNQPPQAPYTSNVIRFAEME
jgi:hypothetical protein